MHSHISTNKVNYSHDKKLHQIKPSEGHSEADHVHLPESKSSPEVAQKVMISSPQKQKAKLQVTVGIESVLTREILTEIIAARNPETISHLTHSISEVVKSEFPEVTYSPQFQAAIQDLLSHYKNKLQESQQQVSVYHWELMDKYFPGYKSKSEKERTDMWFGNHEARNLVLKQTQEKEEEIYRIINHKLSDDIYVQLDKMSQKGTSTSIQGDGSATTSTPSSRNTSKKNVNGSEQPVTNKDKPKKNKKAGKQRPSNSTPVTPTPTQPIRKKEYSESETTNLIQGLVLEMNHAQQEAEDFLNQIKVYSPEYYNKKSELINAVKKKIPPELIQRVLGEEIEYLRDKTIDSMYYSSEKLNMSLVDKIKNNPEKRALVMLLSKNYSTPKWEENEKWQVVIPDGVRDFVHEEVPKLRKQISQEQIIRYKEILNKSGITQASQGAQSLPPLPSFDTIWPKVDKMINEYHDKMRQASLSHNPELPEIHAELKQEILKSFEIPPSHRTKFAFIYKDLLKDQPCDLAEYNPKIKSCINSFISMQKNQPLPENIRQVIESLEKDVASGVLDHLTDSLDNTEDVLHKLFYLLNNHFGEASRRSGEETEENARPYQMEFGRDNNLRDTLDTAFASLSFLYDWLAGNEEERKERLEVPYAAHQTALEFAESIMSRKVVEPTAYFVSFHPNWSTHQYTTLEEYDPLPSGDKNKNEQPLHYHRVNMRPSDNHFMGVSCAVHELSHAFEYRDNPILGVANYIRDKYFIKEKDGTYSMPPYLIQAGWNPYMTKVNRKGSQDAEIYSSEFVSTFVGDFYANPDILLRHPVGREICKLFLDAFRGIMPNDPVYHQNYANKKHTHSGHDHSH